MDLNLVSNDFSSSNGNTISNLPLLSQVQLQQQYQELMENYQRQYNQNTGNAASTEQMQYSLLNNRLNGSQGPQTLSFSQSSAVSSGNNQNSANVNKDNIGMPSSNDSKGDVGEDDGFDVQGDLERDGQHHPIAEFLYQLTKMLTDDNAEIIEWADGRIKVHYPERLEGEVLHKYFRHSKFASFQRQLNYFGFRKIAGKGKMSPCSYVNDAATSDIRSLLLIKRKTNGSAARKAALQQRAAALATSSTLNPLLQFPGAAAALANNPAALASLSNPQALSGAMALLSDNAIRAGLLAQQSGIASAAQFNLSLQQQQQQQQHQAQSAATQALLASAGRQHHDFSGLGAFQTMTTQSTNSAPAGGLLQVDHNKIAQQTQQLQQLQQQLQQLQQQQQQQLNQVANRAAESQTNKHLTGSASSALRDSAFNNLSNVFSGLQSNQGSSSEGATRPISTSAQFEQLLAARLAAASSGNHQSTSLGSLGAASAALRQLQNDNPASAALQQQFRPASAAIDASDHAQASNNLFESALNLKNLLQEHQAVTSNFQDTNQPSTSTRGLMNRLPSSNTIFPSVASFGNLLNSSNRLSSLLSLSSFVGGGGNATQGGPVSSREPSLADLAAAIHPNAVASAPLSAAALAALQHHHNNQASATANQF